MTVGARPVEDRPRPGPELLAGWIDAAAVATPDKAWLVEVAGGRAISYRQLGHAVRRIAARLRSLGIGRNARVALLANNSLEHLVTYAGVMAAGATICTVHVEMNRAHVDAIVPALAPALILCEDGLGLEELAGAVGAPWRPLGRWSDDDRATGWFAELRQWPADAAITVEGDAGADAVIYFTSGTSATPKGVVLTYGELLENALATATAFGMGPVDRIYDCRSFNWASAQILSGLATLARGATLLLGSRFSRSRFFADIARHGATLAAGNPTVLNMLVAGPDTVHARDLPALRFITSSSAPLLPHEWQRFEARFGIPVAQGYGTSETGWIAGCSEHTRRFGSVGRPLPYQCLAIVDRDGRPLPAGGIGHVEIGGHPDVAYRYLEVDGTLRVAATGRVRTGDMGYLDDDGYLFLTGREKDLIIRGGVNISPLEIENTLVQLPGVGEAAAIGVPDPVYGEEIVAWVVPLTGARVEPAELMEMCRARITAYKAPRTIELRDALPKTERGKLDRKTILAQWQAAHAGAG